MGRIVDGTDPHNPSEHGGYESPDQSIHELQANRLHPNGETFSGVSFSQDGTYLRYRGAERVLELPDGTKHTFGSAGRLRRIEDPFGHGLDVDYEFDTQQRPTKWTLTDDWGRQHEVTLSLVAGMRVVTEVKVTKFGGGTASYVLRYATPSIPRACNFPVFCGGGSFERCGKEGPVTVPVLIEVELPAAAGSYEMPASSYETGQTGVCPSAAEARQQNGLLKRIELPTGGAYEYTWQAWPFPKFEDGDSPLAGADGSPLRRSIGLAERRRVTRGGTTLGTWTYLPELTTTQDPVRELVVTETADPNGEQTKHYFSVYPGSPPGMADPPGGWTEHEYGLPFTRNVTDGAGRFLSRRVYDKGGLLQRTLYVRYERSGNTEANPRLVSQRTLYRDNTRSDVDLSGFDGLGHHRTMTTAGTFSGQNVRTTTTNYNPGHSVSSIPDESEAWVLDTYDQVTLTEGGQTVTRDYQFDEATGFLSRVRTRKGAGQGGEDLIVNRIRKLSGNAHHGFLAREDFHGGDGASLPTGVSLDQVDLASRTPVYQRKHEYTCGVLRSSQWFEAGTGSGGSAASFLSPDLDVHCNTGLVSASRDVAGLETTYTYDALGRMTKADLPAGQGADAEYQYDAEGTSGLPARVTVKRKNGSLVLTEEQVRVDGFGRVALERRKTSDGTWAERETDWSSRGWIDMRTEWEAEGDGDRSQTLFRQYDPFGRPGQITLPDGQVVTLSYTGDSRRTISVPVATSLFNGEPVLTTASTTETYDRFGRLVRIDEPNGTATTYAYDALSNLTHVRMNAGGSPQQVRTFGYDHRGFLQSESHPELGTSILYSDYDALGNPGRIRRGGWDLDYGYDAAGRLLEIRDHGTSGETGLWKEWEYATANFQAGQWSNGKLVSAIRHNRPYLPGTTTEIPVPVTESYQYNGVGGRISQVTTTVGVGSPDDNTRPVFRYSLAYDPLGNVSSRTYPQCSNLYCVSKNVVRTVSSTYTQGFLTGVSGYASSLSYHPNGLVYRVAHANGVTDVQEKDPDDLQRPYRLHTTGASEDLDTGLFAYDGAGNVTKMGPNRFTYDLLSRLVSAEVALEADVCGEDRHLQFLAYSGSATVETCGVLSTGPAVRVTSTGDVAFRAGDRIALGDGFRVDSGARFVAAIDPGIEPIGGASEATWAGQYDRFGNLTQVTTQRPGQPSVTRTLPASTTTNRLSGATYDTSGNVTSWAGRSFRHDPFNMLRETGTNVFIYGPGDERIWAIDWHRGADSSNWLETWSLRDLDGTVLRQMKVDGGNTSAANWSFEADYVYRGGALLAAHTPGGVHHFHVDHLGTPRLVTNSGGTILAHHSYFPFGEEATSPTDATSPLQYTGHERDDLDPGGATTRDLDYMHARYHSPHLGRFLSPDPLGESAKARVPQSWNRYSYVQGNPLKYLDPTGEIISFAALSDSEIQKLLEDLRDFTGNEYGVDDNKNLVLLAVGEDSSNTATDFLNELIGSETTFNVVATEGRNMGHPDTNLIEINFGSFEGASYGRVGPSTFNLGSTLVHELDHAARARYDTLDGTRGGIVRYAQDWTSPTVDFVNQIRAERGFPLRAAYVGLPAGFFGRRSKLPFNHVNPKRPERVYYVIRRSFD